jgi:hypothetical protein
VVVALGLAKFGTHTDTFLVRLQVLSIRLVRNGVENSEFACPARNIVVPCREDQQQSREVVEKGHGIQPVPQ